MDTAGRLLAIFDRLLGLSTPVTTTAAAGGYRQREAVYGLLRGRVVIAPSPAAAAATETPAAVALDEPFQLPTKSATEQIVGNEIHRRIDENEEVPELVQGVEPHLRELPRCAVGRRPDDARDQGGRLADEEHGDYTDQHDRRVVPSPLDDDDRTADLPRQPTARRPHGTDEKGVQHGENGERNAVDEGDVQPRVVELAEQARLAESRQVAPDPGAAAAAGEQRMDDEANGPVLEELGDVVGDAGKR